MTENDYIICTNLAKARIAESAIRDMLEMSPKDQRDREAAMRAIGSWRSRLETQVETAQSPATEGKQV